MIDDRELEQLARRIGESRAADVDPQRVAWAVMARLRREGGVPGWWRRWQLLPVTAAAAALLAIGLGLNEFAVRAAQTPEPIPVAVSLNELGTDELTQVLDSLETDVPVSELVTPSIVDLSESELTRLLKAMEG